MAKGFIAALFCLLLLSQKAFAGWYQVKNYEGSIGGNPVHMSLQRYDSFGSGITVEGSYFYDAKQSPIALYGKIDGTSVSLCEISDDKEFQRILVVGSKSPVDTTGCPISIDLGQSGANGVWSKGLERFPIELTQVAALDDVVGGMIKGNVEIPFWDQTAINRFAGVYTRTEAGICMTKLQVIDKRKRKVVQEIGFDDADCNAGMLMTPVYMNVQKHGEDIISVNFRGGSGGYTIEYGLSFKTRKYHRLVH